MSYIISANYRDRSSPNKWLVRKQGEPVEKAKAYRKVFAQKVHFTTSSEVEQGFGCRIVAVADSVQLQRVPDSLEKAKCLVFHGNSFFDDNDLNRVSSVNSLLLTTTMHYLP